MRAVRSRVRAALSDSTETMHVQMNSDHAPGTAVPAHPLKAFVQRESGNRLQESAQ